MRLTKTLKKKEQKDIEMVIFETKMIQTEELTKLPVICEVPSTSSDE